MDPAPDKRFARHLSLARVGPEGQARLEAASVLIVGLGGLGSPAALYLAAAGVRRLVLADFDVVEVSNLQRQIAHATDRVGRAKTDSARQACLALHPDARIECVERGLDAEELAELVPGMDVVLDCSDNFDTRTAVERGVRGRRRAAGQRCGDRVRRPADGDRPARARRAVLALPVRRRGGDRRRLRAGGRARTGRRHDRLPAGARGDQAGVRQSATTGGNGTDPGSGPVGRLLLFDGLSLAFDEVRYRRRTDCPVCAGRP